MTMRFIYSRAVQLFYIFLLIFMFNISNLMADQDSYDSVLDGFADNSSDVDAEGSVKADTRSWISFDFKGYSRVGAQYNFAHTAPDTGKTDWRGLSSLKCELQLDLTFKFFDNWKLFGNGKTFYDPVFKIHDDREYTDEVLDNYEKDLELRELYLYGALFDNLDLKIGRQIEVWGKSDYVRVVDVLNPLDRVIFGLTDIEDLRIPLTMAKLDIFFGSWTISPIGVFEIDFNKLPEYGSDFYPSQTRLPGEDKPGSKIQNAEYGTSINGVFNGWDLSFYWANYYNDTSHLELENFQLKRKHARLNMFGVAYDIAVENCIIKMELSSIYGLKFYNDLDKKYYRTDAMLGFEFSGFKNTFITLEMVNRHLHGYNEKIETIPENEVKENQIEYAFGISKSFINETLELSCTSYFFDYNGDGGAFQRYSVEYDIIDNLSVRAGLIYYQSGYLSEAKYIQENDRAFFELKYNF